MKDIIKIPMSDSIFDELDDAFVDDPKQTSHDFVWGQIRVLCRDAKIGKLNKVCTVNVIENGQPKQESVKLRGFELETISSDPNWIPKDLEESDVKRFEHKITDKTGEYLSLYCSFAILRHTKYVESLKIDNERKIAELIEKETDSKTVDKMIENFQKTIEKFDESRPKCIEEVLFK